MSAADALREGVPWGHSISAHTLLGWCSLCRGCTIAEEVCAWQAWAYLRLCDDPRFGRDAAPTCPALAGPVWKDGGEICGCELPAGHEQGPPGSEWHECPCGAHWVPRRDQSGTDG